MKKILVVDDSKVVRKFIIGCLDKLGFTKISEAENGLTALENVREEMPDIIFLDWNMPVMNGIECIRNLRTLPDGNKPIVIICTTENRISKITEALNNTANEYIMKPFDCEIIKIKFAQLGIYG